LPQQARELIGAALDSASVSGELHLRHHPAASSRSSSLSFSAQRVEQRRRQPLHQVLRRGNRGRRGGRRRPRRPALDQPSRAARRGTDRCRARCSGLLRAPAPAGGGRDARRAGAAGVLAAPRPAGFDPARLEVVSRRVSHTLKALEEAARRVAEREQKARDPEQKGESGLQQRNLASLTPAEVSACGRWWAPGRAAEDAPHPQTKGPPARRPFRAAHAAQKISRPAASRRGWSFAQAAGAAGDPGPLRRFGLGAQRLPLDAPVRLHAAGALCPGAQLRLRQRDSARSPTCSRRWTCRQRSIWRRRAGDQPWRRTPNYGHALKMFHSTWLGSVTRRSTVIVIATAAPITTRRTPGCSAK